jgi:hypothetical protein
MSGVNRFIEVMLQHLNRDEVRTLTGPLQKAYFLLLICICVLGRCPVTSPNICWASIGGQIVYIFLQNVLMNLRINFSVGDTMLSWPWVSKATPNHDAPSTTVDLSTKMLACSRDVFKSLADNPGFFLTLLSLLHCAHLFVFILFYLTFI